MRSRCGSLVGACSRRSAQSPTGSVFFSLGLVLVAYFTVLGLKRGALLRLRLPRGLTSWLALAVDEEEVRLEESIRPPRGRPRDVMVALGALVVVILSSVAMERGAAHVGRHYHLADAVVGGVILAAVTSLPTRSRRCTWHRRVVAPPR